MSSIDTFFKKTRTCACAYQRVGKVRFPGNFASVLDELHLTGLEYFLQADIYLTLS